MPKVLTLQTSFNSGVLDPRLAARTDLKQFYQGAAEAENVVTMPQGGIKRRPGLKYCAPLTTGNAKARLARFAFNNEQTYLIVFTHNLIRVYKDGVLVHTDTLNIYQEDDLFELQWTQSADTMVIFHKSQGPRILVRGSSHTSWSLSPVTLNNIPQYNFGSGNENVWSNARGWPQCGTFHQGRLWFGGSIKRPQTIWGSKTNDFFNFDDGTSLDDEGIDLTLDTDQVNAITSIQAGRHLEIYTTGGEFSIKESPITPSKVAVRRETSFGSKTVPPRNIDGSTIYIDRTGKSVREFLFSYNEDAYTSGTVSILASHLLNSPVDMDVSKGTSNDDANYVYFVNTDGSMAIYNTLRAQEISGWTKWSTSGEFVSIAVVVDEVYVAVKRTIDDQVVTYLEMLDETTYTDANTTVTLGSAGTAVTGLTHLNGQVSRVRADGEVRASATPSSGAITLAQSATIIEVGLDFTTTIKTMPLNMDFDDGPTLTRKKRIVKVTPNVYQSLGISINGDRLIDRNFGLSLNSPPTAFTGLKEMYLLGWTDLAQVTITQTDPTPMTILGLAIEVEA